MYVDGFNYIAGILHFLIYIAPLSATAIQWRQWRNQSPTETRAADQLNTDHD